MMSSSRLQPQVFTQIGEGTKPGSLLRITEIFYSLQGETNRVGLPTVFVRLTGCPLRCRYCDTAYAFHGGRNMSLDEILQEVMRYQAHYVTVTGGEPLAQRSCPVLLKRLCDAGFAVSLETSGAVDVSAVDRRVMKVLDLKTPGSGETGRNRYPNLRLLSEHDQVKFVICDRADYDWAKETVTRFHLPVCCEVLFSPASGYLAPALLADWILADRLPVRFQIQLHKYLWGDVPGR
ncbi:MAG: 7-carboxy-7-deazaguanine synthase QueE [Gammaproteobacteria bacterium]